MGLEKKDAWFLMAASLAALFLAGMFPLVSWVENKFTTDHTNKDVTCIYDGKPFLSGKSDDADFAAACERSIKAFDARLCRGCECQASVDKDGGVYVVWKICPEKKPVLAEEFAEGSGVSEVVK